MQTAYFSTSTPTKPAKKVTKIAKKAQTEEVSPPEVAVEASTEIKKPLDPAVKKTTKRDTKKTKQAEEH